MKALFVLLTLVSVQVANAENRSTKTLTCVDQFGEDRENVVGQLIVGQDTLVLETTDRIVSPDTYKTLPANRTFNLQDPQAFDKSGLGCFDGTDLTVSEKDLGYGMQYTLAVSCNMDPHFPVYEFVILCK